MRVIFLAERTGTLFVNGVCFGTVDSFERAAEVDPADGVFCEFRAAGYVPVAFNFDDAFLFSPPASVELYFSGNSVAVHFYDLVRADPTLSVIWQEKLDGSLLTLFMQGRLQLDLENETGFHLIALPERMEGCKPYVCGDCYLLEAADGFVLLSREGAVLVQANGHVTARGGILEAEVAFGDSAGHTAVCAWRDGKLVSSVLRTARAPTETTFALALFESVRIGADCTPFLADEIRHKAGVLREFLGDFVACIPQDETGLVGLVYAQRERVFSVRRFRAETKDGKIANFYEVPFSAR